MPAQDELGRGRLFRRARWLALGGFLLLMLVGCTRQYYRNFADRDVYRIERDRLTDWRWQVPARPVEAHPDSRIGDVNDPNHVPIPPDEAGARPYQVTAGRPLEFIGWDRRGVTPVEDLRWLDFIPRESDGSILLNGPSAMRIAVMNSRDYQTNVENVYLAALGLTLSRFQFFPQLFSTENDQYLHTGAGKTQTNQLQLLAQNGFNWTLYSGAQILVNFANSLVFEYNGHGIQTANSALTLSFVQPLLQGAWARNFTQPLSLAERQTLYVMRSFAEYRRQFYYNTITGYLGLLLQLQTIRNQQYLVDQQKEKVAEYEALVKADQIDRVSRDQVASQYQQNLEFLLGLQATLQTTLDNYRVAQLGLPADFPMKIDESLLKMFELNDPRLDSLREENEKLYLSLLQYDDVAPRADVARAARALRAAFDRLNDISLGVGKDLARWQTELKNEKGRVGTGSGPTEQDERESYKQQLRLAGDLAPLYHRVHVALSENIKETDKFLATLDQADPLAAWEQLRQVLVSREFPARLSELFSIQTQARVYLIQVKRVDLTLEQAISVALANRLDLINTLAQVTDAWRNVEADGNQLLAGVNLFYNGLIASPSNRPGVFQYDVHNSTQLVGLQISPPLNRRVQRNTYRAGQIAYQRARRAYMLTHDSIVQLIRVDMRNINLNRRQFDISRTAVLIAVRQLEQAEYNARTLSGADKGAAQSAGLNLTTAQNNLLAAKNGLISNWIEYEEFRIALFRDFDTMNIDAQGVWTNDDSTATYNGNPVPSTPDPLRPPQESLFPPPTPTTASPFAQP